MKRGPRPRIFATNPWSKRLKRKSGRVGLAEPVAQVVILHVFDYQAVLENENDFAESARIERSENHVFSRDGRLQVIDAISHVRPMEQAPQPYLLGRHLWRILGTDVFDSLR